MENESIQATAWGEGKFSKIFYWKFHCTQKKQRAYLSTWEIYKFLCRNNTHNLSNTFFFCGFSHSYREKSREQKTCLISTRVMIPSYQRYKETQCSWLRTHSLANWWIGELVSRWSYRNLQARLYYHGDCLDQCGDPVVPTKWDRGLVGQMITLRNKLSQEMDPRVLIGKKTDLRGM